MLHFISCSVVFKDCQQLLFQTAMLYYYSLFIVAADVNIGVVVIYAALKHAVLRNSFNS